METKNRPPIWVMAVIGVSLTAFIIFFGMIVIRDMNRGEDLSGEWTHYEEGVLIEAEIKEDVIFINANFGEGSEGLYWVGSWPEEVFEGDNILSHVDSNLLESSYMGSNYQGKRFKYDGDQIQFDMNYMEFGFGTEDATYTFSLTPAD